MKRNKFIIPVFSFILTILSYSCTDLNETFYDRIAAENFYQTKDDVYRSFLRTFEHGYWTIQSSNYVLQENSADQIATYNREGDWYDGGIYLRMHYHTWTPTDGLCSGGWGDNYMGIAFANNSIEDLKVLDGTKFGLSTTELNMLIAELRVMRAWYYLRLLDLYRNIPIVTALKDAEQKPVQASPQETFNFIETELKEAVVDMGIKGDPLFDDNRQNRWTKAGAMALLVRLYLNSEVYTGIDRFADCAIVCQDIIDGVYGSYNIASRWDEPFDYNNDLCAETIFAFPGSFGYTHWHYTAHMYLWALPYHANDYLEYTDDGQMNPKYALQPGHDVANNDYAFELGKPFVKFQNYPDDYRLTLYKNLGNNTREGMFLFGYLNTPAGTPIPTSKGYPLYIRDQVGWFKDIAPGVTPADLTSNMNHGDENSGIYYVKYPFYKSSDGQKLESDYAEFRLAEIYYSLAECKFRSGDIAGAEILLNVVRSRNYPIGSPSLYPGDGSILTEMELLDEWGREFLAEGRRRIDLIRFDKFNSGAWWDKAPDADDHTKIFPIGQSILNIAPQLKQNPGY